MDFILGLITIALCSVLVNNTVAPMFLGLVERDVVPHTYKVSRLDIRMFKFISLITRGMTLYVHTDGRGIIDYALLFYGDDDIPLARLEAGGTDVYGSYE